VRRAVTRVAGTNLNCKLPSQGGQDCENPLNRLDPVARIVGPALGPASGVSTFGPGCEISAELGPSPACGSGQFLHFGKICQRQVFGFSWGSRQPNRHRPHCSGCRFRRPPSQADLPLRIVESYIFWNPAVLENTESAEIDSKMARQRSSFRKNRGSARRQSTSKRPFVRAIRPPSAGTRTKQAQIGGGRPWLVAPGSKALGLRH